ncbi:MAG: hypothetical protein JO031_04290 [Ktedonobacteraceae bacterium]|nr:hypothetical protein [Ktedonobacteraceae bacterium]
MAGMIHDYLHQVWTALPLSMGKGERTRIVCEIEDHLMESWKVERERNRSEVETLRLVLERFGSPLALAQEFAYLDTQHKRQTVSYSCLSSEPFSALLPVSLTEHGQGLRTPLLSRQDQRF